MGESGRYYTKCNKAVTEILILHDLTCEIWKKKKKVELIVTECIAVVTMDGLWKKRCVSKCTNFQLKDEQVSETKCTA